MTRRIRFFVIFSAAIAVTSAIVLCYFVRSMKKEECSAAMRMAYEGLNNKSLTYGKQWPWLPNSKYSFGLHPNTEPPSNMASSWRFGLSAWLGSGSADNDYFYIDQRWDSPKNIKANNPFFCWTKPNGSESSYWTNVMAIVGPDTGFELQTHEKLQECEDLIICVEVADSGVHWGQPGDLYIDDFTEENLHGIDGDGIMVLFLDGTVWFIKDTVPLTTLKQFFTATGARQNDRETDLREWAEVFYGPVSTDE